MNNRSRSGSLKKAAARTAAPSPAIRASQRRSSRTSRHAPIGQTGEGHQRMDYACQDQECERRRPTPRQRRGEARQDGRLGEDARGGIGLRVAEDVERPVSRRQRQDRHDRRPYEPVVRGSGRCHGREPAGDRDRGAQPEEQTHRDEKQGSLACRHDCQEAAHDLSQGAETRLGVIRKEEVAPEPGGIPVGEAPSDVDAGVLDQASVGSGKRKHGHQ